MKFYHTTDGRWATARPASKAAAAEWAAIDIDTTQRGLLAFLNLHRVGATVETAPSLTLVQPPAPPPPAPDTRGAQLAQDISVEEAIQAADYPRALYLAHQIHHRLMEHARSAQP